MKINMLDHIALYLSDRDAAASFLTTHLGFHIEDHTERYTLVGAGGRLGKLTLFDAPQGSTPSPGEIERITIRASDPEKLTATNAYEVNIWDDRPEKDYATGAIVGVAKVDPMPRATGQWNTYEIVAKGNTFTVTLNGKTTVNGVQDTKLNLKSGRIGLQHGLGNKDAAGVVNDKGVVKFRKLEIKLL